MLASFVMLFNLAACGDEEDAEPAADGDTDTSLQGEITVFAAASLTDAFNDMKADFETQYPEVTVTYNFAGSQQLVTQLVQGARADVFASANYAQMEAAQEGDVIDGEPSLFTRNRLAIIVPSDNPADINEPVDLAQPEIKLVVAAEAVPVGGYTLEVLDKMSADPEFGDDFRAQVEANFVSLEDNVRQVVSKVALGEADAGVVYVTDVTAEVAPQVEIIEIPEEFNVFAEYLVAMVREGNAELAEAFIQYLLSDAGQAVLQEYGFTELPSS
jgi:molybdate transport system substrate-binding protein